MDEISVFVHQLLLRSSYSSYSLSGCSSVVSPHSQHSSEHQTIPCESVITRESEMHASSSLIRVASEKDNSTTIHCDGETNKVGFDTFEDKEEPKRALPLPLPLPPPRYSSSKRSRAAEVHNLSEKRRRSRINEKIKALQNLIPNSNKTDKASMLDEVIEYLKQLQLQVQMLSLQNRIGLHSIYLPEPLQPSNNFQLRFDPGEEKQSQNLSPINSLAINQNSQTQRMSNRQKQCNVSNQLFVPDLSNILDLKTSCGSDASFQAIVEGFLLHKSSDLSSVVTPVSNYATGDGNIVATRNQCSSKEIRKEDDLPPDYFDGNLSERTLSEELGIEAIFSSSLPSEKCASNMKDCSQEASLTGRGQTNVLLENTKGNHAHFSDLDMQITPNYATKRER